LVILEFSEKSKKSYRGLGKVVKNVQFFRKNKNPKIFQRCRGSEETTRCLEEATISEKSLDFLDVGEKLKAFHYFSKTSIGFFGFFGKALIVWHGIARVLVITPKG